MWQDFIFATRTLRQNPAYAVVAIVSLALGIGVNVTVYSLAEALVLRPAPVPDARSIIQVVTYVKGAELAGFTLPGGLSFPEYSDFAKTNKTFDSIAGYKFVTYGFGARKLDQPQARFGIAATDSLFRMVKAAPALGRGFAEGEGEVPGRDAVMVVSHDMWKRDFGGARDTIDKKVWLGGVEFTVIGVLGPDFTGMDQFFRPSYYIPLMMWPRLEGQTDLGSLTKRDDRALTVQGRLKSGVSSKAAAAEAAGFFGQMQLAYSATNKHVSGSAKYATTIRIEQDPFDAMLMGFMMLLVILVLLIACANIANLCLSRGKARAREVAVRLAVGAGRWQVIRQLLIESLVIAVLGGALGVWLAQFGVAAFAGIELPADIPIRLDIRIDPSVLWYALAATVASSVLFGLVPAIQASKSDLTVSLKASPETDNKKGRMVGRNSLVVAQVAGSLVLLIVASQVYMGAQHVLTSPPGYRDTGLIMASFNPKIARYTEKETQAFYWNLLDRARETRGARSVALAQYPPTSNQLDSARLAVEGYDPSQGLDTVTTLALTVSHGYFETLGIPIVAGRGFAQTDGEKSPKVVVVNEQFAKKYFPDGRAIGKSVRLDKKDGERFEVVGIAKQSKYSFDFEPPLEMVYFALPQHPQMSMLLFAQTDGGPSASLADPLRQVVHSIDPGMPVLALRTVEEFRENRSTKIVNLLSLTFAAMAGIGVLLAVVGLYGLMSFNVARRVREIGIRMAIGANRRDVVTMVTNQGLRLAAIGAVLGLAVSFGLSLTLSRSLGVPPFYVPLVIGALLGMMAVAALGALMPALKASNVDPARVMRQD